MPKIVDALGNNKFIQGRGRKSDKDINDSKDNYQEAVVRNLEKKQREIWEEYNPPLIKQNDYSNVEFEKQLKDFYNSKDWKTVKRTVYKTLNPCCGVCWSETKLVVDHINPVRHFWEQRFDIENLQILCDICNQEKGSMLNWTLSWHKELHRKKKIIAERNKNIHVNDNIPRPTISKEAMKPKQFTGKIQVVRKNGTVEVKKERANVMSERSFANDLKLIEGSI